MTESLFVYGAWLRAHGDEKTAVVSLSEEQFLVIFEQALRVNNGDPRSALASIKEALVAQLRRSL